MSRVLSRVWDGRTRQHVAALTLFALLTMIMTWPLLRHIGTAVLGPPQDNYYYLSWFAWLRHALRDLRQLTTFDPGVFHPFGHDYATSETTWANVALVLPVLLWRGEVAAYNVAVLLSFLLSGLTMYLLVYYFTGSWWGGVASGVIYAFCPYRMAHLGGGQLPLLGTQWLPLALWGIEQWLREKRWAMGIWVGLFYALTALSSWYYAFMAGLLLPIYLLCRARPWRAYLRERTVWLGAIAAIAVAALLVIPAVWPTIRLSGQEAMSYSLQFVDRWSGSIADYLLPNPVQTWWGSLTTRFYAGQRYFYERVLALGWVPLLLAGVGLWRARATDHAATRQLVSALLWLAAIAFVLSLGTTLHWRDVSPVQIPVPAGVDRVFIRLMFNWITRWALNPSEYHWSAVVPGHIVLPLPALLFYLYVPFSNAMRVWSRFGFFVMLVIAILAGFGTAALAQRWHGGWRVWGIGAALTALIALEYLVTPFPYGMSEVRAQPATAWLQAQADGGAVMELPLSRALSGPSLYASYTHGKRIAHGYGTFFPQEWIAQRALLEAFPSPETLALLQEWGVRYVLLAAESFGEAWEQVARQAEASSDLRLVAILPEVELYQHDRWFVATRGTALPFAAETIHIYEIAER